MKRRDPQQWLTELYDRHGAELYRYLLAMLGLREDAEDALQNIWSKFYGCLGRVRDPSAYLWRAARNEAMRVLARRGRRREREIDGLEMLPASLNPGISPSERLALLEALRRLPFKQREAVALLAFEDLTAREAGERLGIPTDTAASRYRLALAKLKRTLGEKR